jgi:NitT/TauT family transport system substrate-binding protein
MKRIHKKICAVSLCGAVCGMTLLAGCGKNTPNSSILSSSGSESAASEDTSKNTSVDELVPVTLSEVAHSIFYAPMYVAIEEGYFEEEGIALDLVCGFGADKVMTAVLSGDADIGFMGPETTVYTANEGSKDQVINFAQLTQRAGNFLVSREENPDFQWSDLIGKDVLGGRAGVVHISM